MRHVRGGTRVQEGLGRGGGVGHVAIVTTVLRARGQILGLKKEICKYTSKDFLVYVRDKW